MVYGKQDDKACQNPMKKDGNRPAKPAFLRENSHADDISQHHDAEVDVARVKQSSAEKRTRSRKESGSSRDMHADHRKQYDDHKLNGEQDRVGDETRIPL